MNTRIDTSAKQKTASRLYGWGLAALCLLAGLPSLPAAIFDVDVSGDAYVLYTDPNYPERQIRLGGFSGLYPVPDDPTGTRFYTVTDRGPTQDFQQVVEVPPPTTPPTLKTNTHKVLPCYPLAPMIVELQLDLGSVAHVINIVPLRREVPPGSGSFLPISGRANGIELAPESLKDPRFTKLASDPDALDPEGITMDNHGNFWICEEYRPSIAMVAPDGTVLLRLVPQGCLTGTETIPTYDILPGVLTKRVNNRGMEGITYAPNGRLYAIVQRPLANPDKTVSEASANLRLIEVDIKPVLKGAPAKVRQFLYVTESVGAKVYASDLFALNAAHILVPERATDKLFVINVAGATDITRLETPDGKLVSDPSRTIEQLDAAGLAALHIHPVKKAEVLPSLTALHPELAKCEGVAVVGRNLLLTYDNDFNLADFGEVVTPPPAAPLPLGSIVLKSPDVYPAIITTRLPKKLHFGP